MKCWRNSEGREFGSLTPGSKYPWAHLEGMLDIPPDAMRKLGYELVEKEDAEGFEVEAHSASDSLGQNAVYDDRIIPGKLYSVRKVKK